MAMAMLPVGLLFFTFQLIASSLAQDIVFKINEETPQGSVLGNIVKKLRPDLHNEAQSNTYQLYTNKEFITKFFQVDNSTGDIRTLVQVDRDSLCSKNEICCSKSQACTLDFFVIMRPKFHRLRVTVEITDINDNAPQFAKQSISLDVPESAQAGDYEIALPQATDPDSFINGVQAYRLSQSDDTFRVRTRRPKSGQVEASLVLSRPLDREVKDFYTFILIAEDGGSPAHTGSVTISVRVTDSNDNSPIFLKNSYSIVVSESTAIGEKILHLEAADADIGENAQLVYSLRKSAEPKVQTKFRVDQNTGDIYLLNRLDYESQQEYTIPVEVRDNCQDVSLRRTASATVEVRVKDTNDEVPMISMFDSLSSLPTNTFKVMENERADHLVAIVEAEDKDSGPNAQVECQLDENPRFQLVAEDSRSLERVRSYQLRTTMPLDREERSSEKLIIQCSDKGSPPQVNRTAAHIVILDENDNSPIFTGDKLLEGKFLDVSVAENRPANTLVTTIKATDADDMRQNAAVFYSLDSRGSQDFHIDANSGKLTTKHTFDREERERIVFSVTASDHGQPPRTSTLEVRVSIEDVNDEAPKFDEVAYKFDNIEEGGQVGQLVGILRATDRDVGANGQIRYQLFQKNTPFKINSKSGEITTKQMLDREKHATYEFHVMAIDNGVPKPQSSQVPVTVVVKDRNDNAPIFIFPRTNNNTVYTSYKNPPGTPIATILAKDLDIGQNSKLWYFVSKGNDGKVFEMDSEQGQLIIARKLTRQDIDRYRLTIEVKDSGDHPKSNTMELIVAVNDSPPAAPSERDSLADSIENRQSSMDRNMVLVIGLVVVATVLALTFIIIIVWLRKRPIGRYPRSHHLSVDGKTAKTDSFGLAISNSNYPCVAQSVMSKQKMERSVYSSPTLQRHHLAAAPSMTGIPVAMFNVADQDSGHGSQENLHPINCKTLPHRSTDHNYYRIETIAQNSEPSYYTVQTNQAGSIGFHPRQTYQVLEHNESFSTMEHCKEKFAKVREPDQYQEESSKLLSSPSNELGDLVSPIKETHLQSALSIASPAMCHRVLADNDKSGSNPRLYTVLTSSFV